MTKRDPLNVYDYMNLFLSASGRRMSLRVQGEDVIVQFVDEYGDVVAFERIPIHVGTIKYRFKRALKKAVDTLDI